MIDKEKWIAEMQKAMQGREYNKVAELCGKCGDMNCAEFCPFSNICDWVDGLTDRLPYEYFREGKWATF